MDLSRLNGLLEKNVMKQSFTSSRCQVSSIQNTARNLTYTADTNAPRYQPQDQFENSRSLPPSLSRTEFTDITRCFNRANEKVEGYLDCEELKAFMDLRRCPITDWEASKLLEYADPTYQYYITLDQLVELTTLYGIGTHHPIQMTRSEFDTAIRHAFRLTSTHTIELERDDNIDFNMALSYFESKAAQERGREEYDTAVEEYREMVRDNRNPVIPSSDLEGSHGIQYATQPKPHPAQQTTFEDKSQQTTTEDTTEPVEVDEAPQQAVEFLTKTWESKINGQMQPRIRKNKSLRTALHSSYNTKGIINGSAIKDVSVIKRYSEKEQEPLPIKSVYKRKNVSKPCCPIELIRPANDSVPSPVNSIRNRPNAKVPTSNLAQNINSGHKSSKSSSLPPPPLPPPIVPDFPAEWTSADKVLRSSRVHFKDTSSTVSRSRSASTKTIYRKSQSKRN